MMLSRAGVALLRTASMAAMPRGGSSATTVATVATAKQVVQCVSQPLVRRHAAPAVKFARNLCTAPPTKPPRHPSLASSARRMSSSVPKPRATKTAAVRKPANAARLLVLAVPAIGLGALGYHLYDTEQSLGEFWEKTRADLDSLFHQAADPTPEFMRNSIVPEARVRAQGFSQTLIVDLEGTLVARVWDRKHGYRLVKRPFADELLMAATQAGYEIIVFSELPTATAMETIDKYFSTLPPQSVNCTGMLAREHMFLDEGTYAKQLKYLPREPSRLVLLDHRATSYKNNPNNTLLISKYEDYSKEDTALRDAANMLMAMAQSPLTFPAFLRKYATPTKTPDGQLVAANAVDNYRKESERLAKAQYEKQQKGLGGILRKLKSTSGNLRNAKVINPMTMSLEEIARTKPTGPADGAQKPNSLFGRRMAKMHQRQQDWDKAQQEAAEAAAKDAAQ